MLNLRQHLLGMPIHLHIAPDLDDPAIGPDQKSGPKNALEGLAVHRFFAPDPVGFQHLVLLIRNKRRTQLVLVSKSFLR